MLAQNGPPTHMSPKAELHCYLCRTPCHSWGQHLYYDCVSTALACLPGFKTLASSLQLESPVQWLAVDRISLSIEGSTLHWALVHPATAPETDPLADVALSWSAAFAVRPGAPLPTGSRDAVVRVFLSAIAQWEVLEPLTRRETICCTPNPPYWPAPLSWAAVAVASAFAHMGAPAYGPRDSVPFGLSTPPPPPRKRTERKRPVRCGENWGWKRCPSRKKNERRIGTRWTVKQTALMQG